MDISVFDAPDVSTVPLALDTHRRVRGPGSRAHTRFSNRSRQAEHVIGGGGGPNLISVNETENNHTHDEYLSSHEHDRYQSTSNNYNDTTTGVGTLASLSRDERLTLLAKEREIREAQGKRVTPRVKGYVPSKALDDSLMGIDQFQV